MANSRSIGIIELSSIAMGYQVQDEMLKSAAVEILVARTICSGKYIVVVTGPVSDVGAAVQAALNSGDEAVIDSFICPNVHESVLPALGQSVVVPADQVGALGIVETFSATAIMAGADAAAKAARVTLFRIHLAMALGGKGFCLMTGTVADVRAGVQAAASAARERGLLVNEVVIPRPSPELFADYI